MKSLFPSHVHLVSKVLDMRLERQNAVMSNLANIRTPGYRPLNVEFEEDLQAALGRDARGKMARTTEGHMPSVFNSESFGADFYRTFQPHRVHGQDEVDLDKEMATMSKNTMMYNALTTVIKSNFDGMKKIIQDGKS